MRKNRFFKKMNYDIKYRMGRGEAEEEE
jgi:hypothetical protein